MKKVVPVSKGMRQLPIRAVYLVSMEHDGKKNIISVGMFTVVSSHPRLVGVGIAPSRYSCYLIRNSGEFVVNVIDETLMDAVRICGEKSGRNVNKFELANLTPEKASKTNAPLIKESPFNIECKVVQEVEIGDHIWFIGEVLATYMNEGYGWHDALLLSRREISHGFYYGVGEILRKY